MSFPTCSPPNERFRARKYNGGILPGDGGGKTANSPITPPPWRSRRRRRRRRHGWSSKYETTHNSSFPVKRRRQRRHLETREGGGGGGAGLQLLEQEHTQRKKKRWIFEVEQNRSHDGVRIIISAKLFLDLDSLSTSKKHTSREDFALAEALGETLKCVYFFLSDYMDVLKHVKQFCDLKARKGSFHWSAAWNTTTSKFMKLEKVKK